MNTYYTGDINEFVDWVSGQNNLTGVDCTSGKLVSGGSIRALLLERLKKPLYMYTDIVNGYYRGFSSEDAYLLWASDPTTYTSLLLFYFKAPSPYTVTVNGLPVETKYIESSSIATDGVLTYTWLVDSDNESNISCSMVVVYKVNGATVDTVRYTSSQHSVSYNISLYLSNGNNEVTLSFSAVDLTATATSTIQLYCVQLDLASTFDYYRVLDKSTDVALSIPYTLLGSDGNIRYVNYSIDGGSVNQVTITETGLFSVNGTLLIATASLSSGVHNIQIYASVTIGSITYYSTLLYYQFAVSGLTDLTYKDTLVSAEFSGLKNNIFTSSNPIYFTATLYEQFKLEWAYYTAHPQIDTAQVVWMLSYGDTLTLLSLIQGTRGSESDDLSFFPEVYNSNAKLIPYVNGSAINSGYKIIISQSGENIQETTGYRFKLSATGKSNSSEDTRSTWSYTDTEYGLTYTTTFNNVRWDSTSGWYNNALVLSDGSSASVHFNPLSINNPFGSLDYNGSSSILGRTFEIDFETFNVEDTTSNVVAIGSSTGASILITPNSAIVTNQSGETIVKTNFKENERIRLAFILNQNNGVNTYINNKVFIVNNGILERAASLTGCNLGISDVKSNNVITNGITLGGSGNGVKIYSLKCYPNAITYDNAFYNYVLESGSISDLLKKNNVYSNGSLSETLCEDKLDVILVEGDLDAVIDDKSTDKQVSKPCVIKRICREDTTYNFTIVNGRIRKHGQSTLNYAIPSFKIWTDYYSEDNLTEDGGITTMYNTSDIENLSDEELTLHKVYKGRYQMKENAIPAKKFVLQANYADSSGVHNGGLERLILNTWYNANLGSTSNPDYALRTDPLQYATSTGSYADSGWDTAMKNAVSGEAPDFPYVIRNSPDSFPCVLFYRQSSTDSYSFLGQYVFMDDKKSEHIYGERSIYNIATDPFCLTEQFKSYDTAEHRLWNNKDVRRFEIILLDNAFVNYTDTTLGGKNWSDIIYATDGTWKYAWLNNIEMVYPDQDDLEDDIVSDYKKEHGSGSTMPSSELNTALQLKVAEKALSFTDWVAWLVSTYKVDNGGSGSQAKFEQEASDHLDLYKLAAYYIFCLRFGLVDSMQRNVLVKTYDGVHFHYEPWDMDIAMGSRNTGGIAYDPPLTRLTATNEDLTSEDASGLNNYALSGHDCWLWNALEAWTTEHGNGDGWIDRIVPKVAQALYKAGLTYDNCIEMFDTNYQDKWCERIYNDSGYFKYLQEGNGSYVRFLNGARTTHRHWWLKTSFDYYDSVWSCGDYTTNNVGMQIDKPRWAATDYDDYNPGKWIKIVAAARSYFSVSQEATLMQSDQASKGDTVILTYSDEDFANLSTKQFNYINGAVNIASLDLSCVTELMQSINIKGCYDSILKSSNLKTLNIGMPWEGMTTYGIFHGYTDGLSIDYTGCTFDRLEELSVQGMYLNSEFINFLKKLTGLKTFRAAGSNMTIMQSSTTGNSYTLLQLPDTVLTLVLNDSSWDTIEFYTKSDGKLVSTPLASIPSTLNYVQFNGTTGKQDECKEFVFNWLDSLDGSYSGKTLTINNINWSDITYDLICQLGEFYQQSSNSTLGGYIMLQADTLGTDVERSARLQNIKDMFGENVFTLGSSSLNIDYALDTLAITSSDDSVSVVDGQTIIYEGYSAQFDATLFKLVEDQDRTYNWYFTQGDKTTTEGSWNSDCKVEQGLLTTREGTNVERNIILGAMYSTATYFTSGSLNILVKKRLYPSSLNIEGVTVKLDEDTGKFSIGLNSTYTFKVNEIFDDENIPKGNKKENTFSWSVSDSTYLTLSESTEDSVSYEAHDVPDDPVEVTLTYSVLYMDGATRRTSVTLQLMYSNVILYSATSMGGSKYYMLTSPTGGNITPQSTGMMYSGDLLKATGILDLSGFTSYGGYTKADIGNMLDWTGSKSLFKYMANVTGIMMEGYTNLSSIDLTGVEYGVIDFNGCTSLSNITNLDGLKGIVYILNLAGTKIFSGDVLIASFNNLRQFDIRDTDTRNITDLDGLVISKVGMSKPTIINISNCTSLYINNVEIGTTE